MNQEGDTVGEKAKRLLSILVVVCMVAMSVVNVQEVRASAEEPVPYEYYDELGNSVIGTCSDYSVVSNVASGSAIGVASGSAISVASGSAICASCGAISAASGGAICVSGGAISCATGGAVTWGEDEQQWYVVEGTITVEERIMVATGAAVNLILKDGSKLTASKGINVPEGSELNIFGQGAGSSPAGQLIATGETYCAGIGGGYGQSGGNVTINGGIVIATGGYGAAGIGAGMYGAAGTLTLSAGMSAFASDNNDYGYSPLTSGTTENRRYVIAYKKHSGIMSASGSAITATYIDPMGTKSSAELRMTAPSPLLYGDSLTAEVTLEGLDDFNSALGKTGDDAVSGLQVVYYNSIGEELASVPTVSGIYVAKLTVDGVTAQLSYESEINPPVEYVSFDNSGNPVTDICYVYSGINGYNPYWDGNVHQWYVAHGDVYFNERVTVSGTVNLILMDGCTLTAGNGINVPVGGTLNIYDQGSGDAVRGRLYAYGGYEQAGIGGGSWETAGRITINGGLINATGGSSGAGIGGGSYGSGGTTTINGGSVFATGGIYGAGIGGGDWRTDGGIIIINGGKVTANGGYTSAGIGGGWEGTGGRVSISGGEVIATAGEYSGAGIGGGSGHETTGTISVSTGMKVFASSDEFSNYSPVMSGSTYSGRYAIAYKDYSGIMSVSGNTITATNIDLNGIKNDAILSIEVPEFFCGDTETEKATLSNVDHFNSTLGRTGQHEVSESQIRYYTRDGVELQGVPTALGSYTAKISVDGYTAEVDFALNYSYVTGNDTYWNGSYYSCYVVDGDITLSNRITVFGKVDLVIPEGCKLNATKGITVSEGNELTVRSRGSGNGTYGELIATGDLPYYPGIGSERYQRVGRITINGANVTAVGGSYAAGIGGSYAFGVGADGNYGGRITINGGNVTAIGGLYAAGIGGGQLGKVDELVINGGRVIAAGGVCGAGIGVGDCCSFDTSITVAEGMKVYTSGNEVMYTAVGTGIASRDRYAIAYPENSCVITADGSTVTGIYIDTTGMKVSADLSIVEPQVAYGDTAIARASLDDSFYFNNIMGQNLATPVSDWQIRYYDENGLELVNGITESGNYDGRLTINGVTAVLNFYAFVNPPVTYYYFDNAGNRMSGVCESYHVVDDFDTVWDGTSEPLWCVAHGWNYLSNRVTVSGTVNLILMDECTMLACRGINVSEGNTLNIYGQKYDGLSRGQLNATGDYNQAGIGGMEHENSGTVTISGGIVWATGGFSGAGIGGGSWGSGGTTIINHGEVNAVGGYYAAGIGGGDWYGTGGNIIINGGKINANAGNYAAGIGGGWEGVGGNVTINGGNVTATACEYAGAGIGGGSNHEVSGTVTVATGMKVFASTDNMIYSDVIGYSSFAGRTVYVYKDHTGFLSGYGNTISSMYIDSNGYLQYASLAIRAPLVRPDVPESRYGELIFADEFNEALGRTGSNVVSASDIKYYNRNGVELSDAPILPGSYTAKIILEGTVASVDYDINYEFVREDTLAWDGTMNPGKYYVVDQDVTIRGRVWVTGSVNLLLMDGCTLEVTIGINVSEGNSLTIMDQGTFGGTPGALIAKGEVDYAAIGGGHCENAGNITIYGGTITAYGNYWAAGIGGGIQGSGGIISIYGGNVTAYGGRNGAGIGGGEDGDAGIITIYGGNVYATSQKYGAGIGSGRTNRYDERTGIITIYGGTIIAEGGPGEGGYNNGGAGIGGGAYTQGGNIAIYGGDVTATGAGHGAGIGGGGCGSGGNITLWGGRIQAMGGDEGQALGRGHDRADSEEGHLFLGPDMLAIAWNFLGLVPGGEEVEDTTRILTDGLTGSERYAFAIDRYYYYDQYGYVLELQPDGHIFIPLTPGPHIFPVS